MMVNMFNEKRWHWRIINKKHTCMKKILMVTLLALTVLVSESCNKGEENVVSSAKLKVDTEEIIQDDFLGVGAVYHGFAFMPESIEKGYTDELRDIEFSRVENMELPIARTWYRPDWACGSSGYSSGYDWNSTKMTAFYNWLSVMKSRNVDVAINAGWWCTKDVFNGDEDIATWDEKVEQYSLWMSESLNQIINIRGYTNVKYIHLFTEPTSYESGPLPTGYTQYQAYKEVVTALNDQLVSDGIRSLIKIVGPNNTNWDDLRPFKEDLDDVIDIYSIHGYSLINYDAWNLKATNAKYQISSTGKPLWIDEWGKQDEEYRNTADYGNYIAQGTAAFINAGVQSSLLWILFDQQYPAPLDTMTNSDSFDNGIHLWGTAQFLPTSRVPRPSYYSFSMMSKYMGKKGTTVYSTSSDTDGIYISAVKTETGNWSFLVVNGKSDEQNITIDLSSVIDITLYRHLYDPETIEPDSNASIIEQDKVFNNFGTSFSDVIPARGVAIYTSFVD